MNRPHLISARTSGRRPTQVDLPGPRTVRAWWRTSGETLPRRRSRSGPAGRTARSGATTTTAASRVRAVVPRLVAAARARGTSPAASRRGSCRPPPDSVRSRAAGSCSPSHAARSAACAAGLLGGAYQRLRCRWHRPQLSMRDRPLRAHPAGQLLGPHVPRPTRCGGEERGLAHAALPFARPLPQMLRAQIRAARARAAHNRRPHTPSDRSGARRGISITSGRKIGSNEGPAISAVRISSRSRPTRSGRSWYRTAAQRGRSRPLTGSHPTPCATPRRRPDRGHRRARRSRRPSPPTPSRRRRGRSTGCPARRPTPPR